MRRLNASIFCLALAACQQAPVEDQHRKVPTELQALHDVVFKCHLDAQALRFEHSEHCVISAETILEPLEAYNERCDRSNKRQSVECLEFDLAHSNIFSLFQMAIINSSLRHGVSQKIEERVPESAGLEVYLDSDLMRELFEKCLQDEAAALAKEGLKRVHSVFPTILEDDQMCVRAGAGVFETQPL